MADARSTAKVAVAETEIASTIGRTGEAKPTDTVPATREAYEYIVVETAETTGFATMLSLEERGGKDWKEVGIEEFIFKCLIIERNYKRQAVGGGVVVSCLVL
jgi:hypothetical protein